MCAPSHLRSSHLRSSYHILYLRICVTSAHLHISDLYIFTFIFRSSYFETASCLHTVGSSSRSHTVLSYHLQDFIMQLLSQLYNWIYLRLQDFISPLSGQPSSSCSAFLLVLPCSLLNVVLPKEAILFGRCVWICLELIFERFLDA